MKNYFSFNVVLLCMTTLLFLASCQETKTDDENPRLINPSDANALSEVLIMPAGTQTSSGNPPSPSNSAQAPDVTSNGQDIISSNGSTAPFNYSYQNAIGNLGGCYVQVDGAGSYFTIPYGSTSGNSGSLQLPIGIPTNVLAGSFCVNFCVYDGNGLVSNVITTCVEVLRLGTGSLQISLSWDNSSDQDLYVTDPGGETISYFSSYSTSGGQLDRDDVDGFGPENIFWDENAPDGTYQVKVNDFEGTTTVTTFYVTVSGPNTSRNFTGTTSNGSTANVVTFSKSGDNLNF